MHEVTLERRGTSAGNLSQTLSCCHPAGSDRAAKWQQASLAGRQAAEAAADAQRKVGPHLSQSKIPRQA